VNTADRATEQVEFEQMLLSRYMHLHKGRGRRTGSALDRSAYILLSRIRTQGPMSIGQLGDAFGLDASTLNRQTAAAMRAGLVERIPDPEGGMARKFRITEEGERRLDEERTGLVASLDRIMADWPEEDIAAFADYLRRFNSGIERLHGMPWPRPHTAEQL
jgi:DNA-binding MarR family transcriptional regulator